MSVDTEMGGVDMESFNGEVNDVVGAFTRILGAGQISAGVAMGACMSILAYAINQQNDDLKDAMNDADATGAELRRMVSSMHEAHRAAVAMGVEAGNA